MQDLIAELSLSREAGPAEWLPAALEGLLDTAARVVLLDATSELPEAPPWPQGALRDIALFELPVVLAFEGALRGPWTDLALAADIRVCGEGASLQGRLAGDARARVLAGDAVALELYLGRTALDSARLLDVEIGRAHV